MKKSGNMITNLRGKRRGGGVSVEEDKGWRRGGARELGKSSRKVWAVGA